ncbi:MAG TPA: hypothetical protein VHF69_10735 [Candidatus Synoicihabitans sp.]|nr:hypothetical protein [Candidatus Synoicihabitans sp.]
MKFFRSPLFATIVGTLLGVTLGLGAFWQAAQGLIVQARQLHAEQAKAGRPERPWDFWTLEIDHLAAELRADRAELDRREEEIKVREARLDAESLELARVRAELEALRANIATRVIQIQEDEERNLKSLAQTYSNLTPRSALVILNQLDEPTAVKILALMKPEVAGALFELMGQAAANDPAMARRAAMLSDRLRLLRPASKTAAN